MSKSVELASIYIDLVELRKTIFEALYTTDKKDRMLWGDTILESIGDTIKDFVLAYTYPDERDRYTRKLVGDFAMVKVDVRSACEFGIFKGKKAKDGELVIKKRIFLSLGRIDKQIGKWVNSQRGRGTSVFVGCDRLTDN